MERVYYSIKEVSEITGLEYSTLRLWEKMYSGLTPYRNAGKTRFYTQEDIDLIKQIKFLRDEEHLSPKAIQRRLATNRTDVNSRQKLSELLQKIKQELVDIRETIK